MTASFTNATTTTQLAELIANSATAARIIEAAYSRTVGRGLVANFTLAGENASTMEIGSWPTLTAASVAETADLSNTAIDTGGVSISVGEIGIMAAITDVAMEDTLRNFSEFAAQLGFAIADKEDADILALVASFSNTTGSDADALTYADHIAALRELEGRDAPGPLVATYHPVQVGQLHNDVAQNGGAFWSAGNEPNDQRFAQLRNSEGSLAGVTVYSSTNVPTGGTTGYYGGMFSANAALAYVGKRGLRIEQDRDGSARLTEVIATIRYGVGEVVDSYGETVISDSTAA